MATVNQLVKGARTVKAYKSTVPALQSSPQKRGVCTPRIYNHTKKNQIQR